MTRQSIERRDFWMMDPRVQPAGDSRESTFMATFHFDLVSPEKIAFSGEVDQVDIPGVEGDFGVLAGHAPVVAAIRPGILTVTSGGTQQKIIVLGGLAEVSDKGLTVLADVATSMQDLDREKFADKIS